MKKDALSLIECTTFVAVLGILAAIATPNYLMALVRAKISRVHSELKIVSDAVEMYRAFHEADPAPTNDPNGSGDWFHKQERLLQPPGYLREIYEDPFFVPMDGIPNARRVYDLNFAAYQPEYFTQHSLTEAEYAIRSAGPDGKYMREANRTEHNFYEVSNGIISGGDILRVKYNAQ